MGPVPDGGTDGDLGARLATPALVATLLYTGCVVAGMAIAPTPGPEAASSGPPPTVRDVLWTNLSIIATVSFGGVLGGLPTLTTLAINGVAFGALLVSISNAVGPLGVLAAVGPHALFEIPALLIAAASGFSLPAATLRRLVNGDRPLLDRPTLLAFGHATGIAVLLTLLAAIVEVAVTPRVVAWLG